MHHAPRYGIYQEKRTAKDAATAAPLTTTGTGLFAGAVDACLMSLLLFLSIIKRDRDGKRKEEDVVSVVIARSHAK